MFRSAACMMLVLAAPAWSAAPVVPGYARFPTSDNAGPLLLSELNCTSCHQGTELAKKQAPVLDHVGGRVRVGHLRKFLRDPQAVKPGTTMPGLFAQDADADAKVEALVHFLASTGSAKHSRPDRKRVASGRDLYHKVGCVACHGTRKEDGNVDKVFTTSVPLGELQSKYTLGSLTALLEQPHAARPAGRMPKLLNNKEAIDVANYLLQGVNADFAAGRGSTKYSYYEGDWNKLPDFATLKPKATGTGPGFDLGVAQRGGSYALKFEGVFKLEREGTYAFTLNSDDGSRLLIDGKQVVNNDGTHPPQAVSGSTKLAAGIHKAEVLFFQGGGGAELEAWIEAPGAGRQSLGDLVATSEEALNKKPPVKEVRDDDALDIQPALVEKGRALFTSVGCASCHQLAEKGNALASTLKAPTLVKLNAEGGCLADTPKQGLPRYGLDGKQRTALAAVLRKPPAPAKTPTETIAQTLVTFNCYACHSRDKIGGPEEDLNKFFQTVQPEMGDEGRLPPPLDGIGAKLKPEYFKHLLDQGVHDRPYMHTRMPGFGNANVGHLVDAFAGIDKIAKTPVVEFRDTPGKVKSQARHLVGSLALGCIKCHTFNGQKAEGVQGIDMTLLPKRLNRDWFHAYIADPQRIRPGTRMPSAYMDGVSVLPDILGGKAGTQIEAMWLYLADGANARAPVGMSGKSIPLIPTDTAIIYRNFIEGAGTRGIAVGYPEKMHVAFDANEMRLSMLWQGAFLDAGKHWTDRGSGFEGPLGDNILKLPGGVSFAALEKPDALWPAAAAKAQGYRFLGYRTTPDDRPTFLYAAGEVKVEDFFQPKPGKEPTLRRTLTLSSGNPPADLQFRAAVGKIEKLDDGWYRIDGTWKLKLESEAAPTLRTSAGKTELLVPLRFTNGKTQVVQEFAW